MGRMKYHVLIQIIFYIVTTYRNSLRQALCKSQVIWRFNEGDLMKDVGFFKQD